MALFLSDEGPMLETLDYTIHIGSTPTFLYFDLYLYSAYAAHYVYYTTFITLRLYICYIFFASLFSSSHVQLLPVRFRSNLSKPFPFNLRTRFLSRLPPTCFF